MTTEKRNELEEGVRNDFRERIDIMNQRKGETIKVNPNNNINDNSVGNTKGDGDDKYFLLYFEPKYQKTGVNMEDFIKIDGGINPNRFMNSVVNLLKGKKIVVEIVLKKLLNLYLLMKMKKKIFQKNKNQIKKV